MAYLVIDQGTIVTNNGFSFDPTSKSCMSFTECCTHPYVFQYDYCCTNFTYITFPDMEPKPCLEFKGTTMLVDANVNIISLLTTTYGITASGLNVSLTTNLLQPPFVTTNIFPNYVNYDCTSSISSSCSFMLQRGLAINSLYNMFMRGNTAEEGYGELFLSNKIIKRNGIYVKDDNTLFTPNDSCSTVTSPFIDGLRTLNTLCCTKFQGSTEEINNNGKFVQSKRNLRRPKPTPYHAIN
uniref:Uncharacterized protein n=1 Tax=Panagrolaimus davidi TaxID=227884 RepID=A0A914PCG0_9BILA